MPTKKSKKAASKAKQSNNTLALELDSTPAELLAQIPWFNERYLLPGEEISDYDSQLQSLIDSVEVNDALDLILVKDIHDELREVQRMRALRQALILKGMANALSRELSGSYLPPNEPRVEFALALWDTDPQAGNNAFIKLLDEAEMTMGSLMSDSYLTHSKQQQQLELQLARHEKNVRESLKMIEQRKNHKLMRQRIELDIKKEEQQLLTDSSDDQ